MRTKPILLAALAAMSVATPAIASIPAGLKNIIESAIASGDAAEVAVVVKHAKRSSPEHAAAIQQLVDSSAAATLASVSPPPPATAEKSVKAEMPKSEMKLSGKGEFGGSLATGNSEYAGLVAGFSLKMEEGSWRHVAAAQLDFQESRGSRTRQRLVASYQPHYRVDGDLYVYGLGQYEHDRVVGYDNRYAVSAGIGYRLTVAEGLRVDLEAGPAYRFTDFTDGNSEGSAAGRGSLRLDWKATDALSFNQTLAVYGDSLNSTVSGTSAVNAKLFGPLSARLSYNLQFESDPPPGRVTTDTLSRASLVYEF